MSYLPATGVKMDTTEILIKIRRIVRSINLESKKIQKTYGISIPQVLCLSYLRKSENFQASQGEIARYLNLTQSTVNGIIKRLEVKGLIARLPKSGDKRVVRLALTSDGDRLLSRIPSLMHDRLSLKLDKMETPELSRIEETLMLLIELLEIHDIEASPMITSDADLE